MPTCKITPEELVGEKGTLTAGTLALSADRKMMRT